MNSYYFYREKLESMMEKKEVAVNLFGHDNDEVGDNMSLKKRLNPE